MTRFAGQTTVPVDKTKNEIEKLLQKYGADQFFSGWDEAANLAMIGFKIKALQVKMFLPLPDRKAKEFTEAKSGYGTRPREERIAVALWEQACRSRWRALLLIVKAKLEAVESQISTLEKEFLPDTVMANGQTVYQWARPQLNVICASGQMPPLLPGFAGEIET